MSIMRSKLEKDAKRIQNEKIRAKNEKWNLNRKLKLFPPPSGQNRWGCAA